MLIDIKTLIESKEQLLQAYAKELDPILAQYFWDRNEETEEALSSKTIEIIDLEYEINELKLQLNQIAS